jgi:CO/xanthine dehydrogenase Mo-binding subunit
MNAHATTTRREFLQSGAALVVGFALPSSGSAQVVAGSDRALGKTLNVSDVDGFIAIHPDSSVTLYCGKVDLGQGLRIAMRQMAAEELGIDVATIAMIEGDTSLTPDQGPTAGSSGVMRGGTQIRQAAASAREALLRLAAERTGKPASELECVGGNVRAKGGGTDIRIGDLVGDKRFAVKVDSKAPLKDPSTYKVVGQSLPRPDVPAKVMGRHVYVHDFAVPDMLHGRAVRSPVVGAKLLDVDEASIKSIPGARVVRLGNFLGVVAPDEWDAVVAARTLKVQWSDETNLIGNAAVRDWLKTGPFEGDDFITRKGDAKATLAQASTRVSGEYYWPLQTHGSMGPSCSVADVKKDSATIWTASQATHKFRETFAKMLELPQDKVRLIYLDGAGCYGMNGHDDAAADAMLLSRAVGKPVRVQWMRADEHGFDPKGPPQLLAIESALDADGRIAAWRTEMWLPKATANLPNVPLLGPEAAGIAQAQGISTGLISQNGAPGYPCANTEVQVHWHKTSPLRPSNIRAPGKIANCFAVESLCDELAAAAKRDPFEWRLANLNDPRGAEVLKRAAALIDWKPRVAPAQQRIGRGIAYIHYKDNETYVATALEADVDRASGAVRVLRVGCAHDCGLVINPDALSQQIEGCILQTLSRTLLEEVVFDRSRVTSVDWASYPILTFAEVPEIKIDLVLRQKEPPLGAGEAAATTVPAALANAIYDATGKRLRTVPFTRERVKAALA